VKKDGENNREFQGPLLQLLIIGAVSTGQRNTCSTCLLAGVLRAKVGREGWLKKHCSV